MNLHNNESLVFWQAFVNKFVEWMSMKRPKMLENTKCRKGPRRFASWIPFKFCMWLNLWWHGKIKRFEWQRWVFFANLLQPRRPLCSLTLGLIVEKYICLCQKPDVERCQLWLELETMSRQWVDEARRRGPFLHFVFSNIFGCFIDIHSTDLLTNACQNTSDSLQCIVVYRHFCANKSDKNQIDSEWELMPIWLMTQGRLTPPHVLSSRKKWRMIKRAALIRDLESELSLCTSSDWFKVKITYMCFLNPGIAIYSNWRFNCMCSEQGKYDQNNSTNIPRCASSDWLIKRSHIQIGCMSQVTGKYCKIAKLSWPRNIKLTDWPTDQGQVKSCQCS